MRVEALLWAITALVCVSPAVLPAQAHAAPPGLPSFCQTTSSIIPGRGIGRLTLNMPAQNARRLLDAAGDTPRVRGGPPPALRQILYTSGPNRGVEYYAKDSRVRVIILLPAAEHLGCTTPDGIHLGSSESDVTTAYGQAPLTRDLPSIPHAHLLIYNVKGIAFAIIPVRGRTIVAAIQVFAPGTYCVFFTHACSP